MEDSADGSDSGNSFFDIYGPEVNTLFHDFILISLCLCLSDSDSFSSWQAKPELVFKTPETKTLNLQVGFTCPTIILGLIIL